MKILIILSLYCTVSALHKNIEKSENIEKAYDNDNHEKDNNNNVDDKDDEDDKLIHNN